jgi:phage tail sheath protein FI
VAWPPANVTVRGVSDLEVRLDWDESGELAERNVNPLVLQTARGVVVWGGRTLSTDPDYRNINSRRVVSMVSEQLRRDNEWAVFEQNNSQIWAVLERNARIRMEEFWRAGLITSEAPKGDYLVQCDRENNPRIERDAGKLNVRVRLRPIGMTEHVTIDLRLGESGT